MSALAAAQIAVQDANAKNGDSLGYDYIYENFDIVKSQLFIAGVRLAQTLNDIFDG